MERKDRAVYDKKGNVLRWSKRWKIPIPYPQFINEISLVFLYGRPVKWQQLSTGTDYAFQNYKDCLLYTSFLPVISLMYLYTDGFLPEFLGWLSDENLFPILFPFSKSAIR